MFNVRLVTTLKDAVAFSLQYAEIIRERKKTAVINNAPFELYIFATLAGQSFNAKSHGRPQEI